MQGWNSGDNKQGRGDDLWSSGDKKGNGDHWSSGDNRGNGNKTGNWGGDHHYSWDKKGNWDNHNSWDDNKGGRWDGDDSWYGDDNHNHQGSWGDASAEHFGSLMVSCPYKGSHHAWGSM